MILESTNNSNKKIKQTKAIFSKIHKITYFLIALLKSQKEVDYLNFSTKKHFDFFCAI